MARLRSAPASQNQNAAPTTSSRPALREKTNISRSKPLEPGSEGGDKFVKDARPTRGRAKKAAQNEDDLVMAGGLGLPSDLSLSDAPMTTDELAKSDSPAPPSAKTARRPPRHTRKPAHNEAQGRVYEDMKKRMRQTAQNEANNKTADDIPGTSDHNALSSDALPTKLPARKSTAVQERSEFSMSPSPPPPGKLSAVKNKRSSVARPGTVLKSQSTPAPETSILALKNFKRRPRQPSMLAMVQQRTASARPSMAYAQGTEVEDPSVFDLDSGEEDEDDFAPDAEGTPLHLRAAKRTSLLSDKKAASVQRPSTSRSAIAQPGKRKSDHVESSSLSALKAKRQKVSSPELPTEEAIAIDESPVRNRESSVRQETPLPQIMSEVQVINSSPSTTPPTEPSPSDYRQRTPGEDLVVPSTEEAVETTSHKVLRPRTVTPRNHGSAQKGTMADPASSSPSPEEPTDTQATNLMADPLTQITPAKAKPPKPKKAKPMMTSTLQSLLPKRRQPLRSRHRKSIYDVDTESDDDDADSGQEADVAPQRRRQTKTVASKPGKTTAKARPSTTAAGKGRKSTAPLPSTRKSTAPPARRKTAATTKNAKSRTYGRNAQSDKENNGANSDFEEVSDNDDSALPDTSLSMQQAEQSAELAAVKAKFAEVDAWDMDFESVSFEEGRSSSQNWR